ncbi:MAG: serine/threonine-protein phosphatase [Acidobacteria bacterium]|nr:serine/threonine-protein phosphatase [Acidobacteriota bacterium]
MGIEYLGTAASGLTAMVERAACKLACMEVWGGNGNVASSVELPGLAAWVYSTPVDSRAGGDVHYLSVCDQGVLSRVTLADVKGHGEATSSLAKKIRTLMRRHINTWDQADFMRELNRSFHHETSGEEHATAVVLGFLRHTSQLVYTNAGHLPPLWYQAAASEWGFLKEDDLRGKTEVADLPLGLIPGTEYHQSTVRFSTGDMLVLYTDGLTEAVDGTGEELGSERLLELTGRLRVDSAVAAGRALLTAVRGFRQGMAATDDETLIVLHRAPA